jgi:hypothetical protein
MQIQLACYNSDTQREHEPIQISGTCFAMLVRISFLLLSQN